MSGAKKEMAGFSLRAKSDKVKNMWRFFSSKYQVKPHVVG
jgi:hypothetical protein